MVILKVFYICSKIKQISKYINTIRNRDFLWKRKDSNIKLTKIELRKNNFQPIILWTHFIFPTSVNWKSLKTRTPGAMRPPSVQILISKTNTHEKELSFSRKMTDFRSEERKVQGKSATFYCSEKLKAQWVRIQKMKKQTGRHPSGLIWD